VPYKLSDTEARLYREVTDYVREEFNRAEALANDGRAGTVGFALTILQRRLASSPEAIYQSLHRRSERLQKRLRDLESLQRGAVAETMAGSFPALDADPRLQPPGSTEELSNIRVLFVCSRSSSRRAHRNEMIIRCAHRPATFSLERESNTDAPTGPLIVPTTRSDPGPLRGLSGSGSNGGSLLAVEQRSGYRQRCAGLVGHRN